MENIKTRNLYLPVLHKTKFFENNRQQINISAAQNNGKSSVIDMLKLIQRKKVQLQRNIENQESDDSSDNQDTTNPEPSESTNEKSKIIPLDYSQQYVLNPKSKVKTVIDQNSEPYRKSNTSVKTRHFRVRTQHNQISSKSTQNTAKMIKKIKPELVQNSKPPIKYLNPKEMSREIRQLLSSIPLKMKDRNEITLKQIVEFLQQQNPFFMKLDRVVAICLLKVCKIVHKTKRQTIYERQSIQDKFFVILGGRVKISNAQIDLKKVCVPGQTFLEQTWVNFNDNKQILQTTEKARSVGSSYLLQIPLEKFKKVKQQLLKFGFKTQYIELEALIKRNYIHKNAIRKEKNKF